MSRISVSYPLFFLAALATCALGWEKPSCPLGRNGYPAMEWLADARDCSTFYVCNRGQRFDFSCGENVWDQATKTCVGKGSQWDKCTIAKELDSLTAENELSGLSGGHPCGNSNTAVLAKSDNCAQYYDCSSREGIVSDDPYLQECEFPLLFNPNTKRCEHYDMVKCGDRMEPLDACDYVANQCQGRAHCVPCSVRFPSCRDLPDGLNPWVGREYSPYYVLCEKQRPLYHGQCDNSHGTQIFDPEKRVCDEFKGNN